MLARPSIRRPAHLAFYRLLAGYVGAEVPVHFMNYGFESDQFRRHPLGLRPEHANDRLGIQLYDHLLSPLSMAGKTVLEVGCGRGGGAAYVANYLGPRRVVGLDFCHKSVRICVANHDRQVAFLTGDALRLPFRDASFDIVLNVESSHAYTSMTAFLIETHRVLKPGGSLVFGDLRWAAHRRQSGHASGLTQLQQQLRACGLVVAHESDISAGVLQARTACAEDQRALVTQHVPRGLRAVFAELAALPGTTMYRHLEDGHLVYWSAILHKRRATV
jgi:SAM-dependent methyltransferase